MPGMNYDRVSWLADQVGLAATALDGARLGLDSAPSLGLWLTSAFGNTANATNCMLTYTVTKGSGATAAANLTSTLSTDVARMRQVIEVFRATDHEAADEICAAGSGTLSVFSAHLESGTNDEADALRAEQVENLSGTITDAPGQVTVGMDANMDYQPDGRRSDDVRGPAELIEMRLDHDLVDVGDADGAQEQREDDTDDRDIDHVFTSDTVTATEPVSIPADSVGGELLDHPVQVTTQQPARW